MILEQYYIECLSQASYLIGDETTGRAVVVDPRRDITEYLADAQRYGLTIEGVINTHFHADFVSGHLELVRGHRGVDRLRRGRRDRLPDPPAGRRRAHLAGRGGFGDRLHPGPYLGIDQRGGARASRGGADRGADR